MQNLKINGLQIKKKLNNNYLIAEYRTVDFSLIFCGEKNGILKILLILQVQCIQ